MEGIQGGTTTDCVPATQTGCFIQVSGNTLTLLEPPEDDPGEGTSAAAGCSSADEETILVDFRRHEDPDSAQPPRQPGNINSQTVQALYAQHLQKQITLADVKIQLKSRKLQETELDLEIKRRTLMKLDLEIQKLEQELPNNTSVK
ncbi:hypothetical protein GBF38_000419%2C partial [Xyrichtys novacula]|uniref:Uncharacterized protein n=1 Tax=Xyrichtys novacula TaxID=13765 RepID=A0AAV1EI75_XYRNO|nr:hypothetical protein GBF38_000419%2C partial [Xyrichtys novacula]